MSEINWQDIRTEYEEQGSSLRSLAAKYGVAKSVIGDRKYKEQWERYEHSDIRTSVKTQGGKRRDVNAALRASNAMKLVAEGLTYEEAAHRAGYANRSSCYNAIQRELDRVVVADADYLRNLTAYRLDKLLGAVWPLAVPDLAEEDRDDGSDREEHASGKSHKPNLFAVDRALLILKSQRELWGLDRIASEVPANQLVVREVPVGWLQIPVVNTSVEGNKQ